MPESGPPVEESTIKNFCREKWFIAGEERRQILRQMYRWLTARSCSRWGCRGIASRGPGNALRIGQRRNWRADVSGMPVDLCADSVELALHTAVWPRDLAEDYFVIRGRGIVGRKQRIREHAHARAAAERAARGLVLQVRRSTRSMNVRTLAIPKSLLLANSCQVPLEAGFDGFE